MRAPTLDFGTVVILSTIRRQAHAARCARSAPRADGTRSFGLVSGEGADGDRVRRIESVVLHDDDGARLTRVILAARDRPDVAAPHSSSRSDTASINA